MEKETSPESLIGYVYEMTTVLGEGQQLNIKGNLALDAEVEDMNKQFDKLMKVMSRLSAFHKIDNKKADISGAEAMIASMKLDIATLDKAHEERGARPLPTAEKNNRDAMLRNIQHLEGKLAGHRKDLEGLEALVK